MQLRCVEKGTTVDGTVRGGGGGARFYVSKQPKSKREPKKTKFGSDLKRHLIVFKAGVRRGRGRLEKSVADCETSTGGLSFVSV